ncbi:MAG: malate dehydrogenase [Candidatus Omnitrophica bacterium]|nr:malate dehydrogenase [Candidatus Omnitrophota bacterium]
MAKPKVTVVGAGFVGSTTAQRLVEKEIADVVLIDVVEGLPQGKALDMMESAPVEGFSTAILGTNRYEDTQDSDVIVITAGLARKPGMTRDDLLFKNAEIVGGIVEQCARYSPSAVIITVTNPLDVMTYLAWKKSGFETRRVFGMAGELDSARCAYFIAEALGCKPADVKAMVLGGHGDEMVPVPQHTFVQGRPVTELLPADKIEQINQRTRDGGAEIVKYLKTGSAYYAPSSSAVRMVRAVLGDTREVIPVCAYLTGEYGIRDVYCGVPARLGRSGILEVVELPITEDQRKALHVSAEHVRENCAKISTTQVKP